MVSCQQTTAHGIQCDCVDSIHAISLHQYESRTRIKPGTRKLNLSVTFLGIIVPRGEGLDYRHLKHALVMYTLVIYSLNLRIGYLTARRVSLRVSPFGLSGL